MSSPTPSDPGDVIVISSDQSETESVGSDGTDPGCAVKRSR